MRRGAINANARRKNEKSAGRLLLARARVARSQRSFLVSAEDAHRDFACLSAFTARTAS